MSEWFKDAFGPLYSLVYSHRNEEEAMAHIPLIVQRAELNQSCGKILDLGCGEGRYSSFLIKQGLEVFALDYSAHLLSRRIKCEGLNYIQGDMRTLPFVGVFDRILSLFTSFGYFDADDENANVLGEMSKGLKVGGLLYLDYLNPAVVQSSDWSEVIKNEYRIASRKDINTNLNLVKKQVRIFKGDKQVSSYEEKVKLYNNHWFEDTAKHYGLKLLKMWSNYENDELLEDEPRNIYLFIKED